MAILNLLKGDMTIMAKKKNEKLNSETVKSMKVKDETNKEVVNEEEKENFIGIVSNCSKLNIRDNPDDKANILAEASALSKLEIDKEESTKNWYKVTTASGISGFCKKQFVSIER